MSFPSFDFAAAHAHEQALPVELNLRNENVESCPDDAQPLISVVDNGGSIVVDDTLVNTLADEHVELLHDRQVDDNTMLADLQTSKPSKQPCTVDEGASQGALRSPSSDPTAKKPAAHEASLPDYPSTSLCNQMEAELQTLAASQRVGDKAEAFSTVEAHEADKATRKHTKRVKELEEGISTDVKACI